MGRRFSVVAAGVAAALGAGVMSFVAAPSVSALPLCSQIGPNWNLETSFAYDRSRYTVCWKYTPGGPSRTEYAYMVFADLRDAFMYSGQQQLANGTSTEQPRFAKRTVSSWASYYPTADIVINGAPYLCTEATPSASCVLSGTQISYPLKVAGTLLNSGFVEPGISKRYFGWTNSFRPANYLGFAVAGSYTLTTNDWSSVDTFFGTPATKNAVVSWSPAFGAQEVKTPLTYMGVMSDTRTMCFYVGGFQTRSSVRNQLGAVGCNPTMQLDGGPSSQLTMRNYNNPSDPAIIPIVRSASDSSNFPLDGDRAVPQVFYFTNDLNQSAG